MQQHRPGGRLAAVDGWGRVHMRMHLDWQQVAGEKSADQQHNLAGAELQKAANALMSCHAFDWHPSAFGQCAWGGRALLRVQK
jgi:hypothetical protein